jgi:hypothetical protein
MTEFSRFAVRSLFGCQQQMTGLFRTQVENGIMGLSPQKGILPKLLHQRGIVASSMFAMCLQVGGGFLSIGDDSLTTCCASLPLEYDEYDD